MRPGLHEELTLSYYIRLLDESGRMARAGKANLEADLALIFERLKLDRVALEATVAKLFQPAIASPINSEKRPLSRSPIARNRQRESRSPRRLDFVSSSTDTDA